MRVYLIGAGPGDPELISVKAQRILKKADVVLYDYLVHPNIVMMADSAEKICVGKKGAHSAQQEEIHELMIRFANEKKIVARLKGGDPMVFGRCAEEMKALNEANISYEVIPGITSAIAAPTYAGIPITHRDYSHSVAFVTATRANDVENIHFPNADTLVIMMSLLRLAGIVSRLKTLRSKDTPIAIIESGTYATERMIVGTLATIESIQATHQLKPPALMVVGDVAALGRHFNWRQYLPLKNRRFVLSRATHQQSFFVDQLLDLGAEVLSIPMNDIESDPSAMDRINLADITHIIFTSENGVRTFFEGLIKKNMDSRTLAEKMIVAIGQHTEKCLASFGIMADILPKFPTSQGILDEMIGELNAKHHVLIPTSSEADDFFEQLTTSGASVTKIVMYKNKLPSDIYLKMNWIKPDDIFVFMNSAAVHRISHHYKDLKAHAVFSIGPKTTAALTSVGVTDITESNTATVDSVIQSILSVYQ